MELSKCSFPSCEPEVVGTGQIVKLSLSESEVLQYRYEMDMKYLCGVHYNDQFKKYVYWHNKKCADPCQRHARPRKTRLAVIELETARMVKNNTEHRVIPGQSVCQECCQFLMELVTESEHQEQPKEQGSFSGDLPMDCPLNRPLSHFSLVVAMSVCVFVCPKSFNCSKVTAI